MPSKDKPDLSRFDSGAPKSGQKSRLGLMAAGGVLSGLAETYVMLMAGRFVSGVGAILLNVLMSKMVTD